MLGVSKHNTSKGIGQQLFLKNEQFAIDKKMNSIYWSFNPLDPSAANLYLHKLNAIIKKPIFYNMYGIDDNGLPTDRFLAVLEISPNIKKSSINNSFPENFQIDSSLINSSTQFNLNNHNSIAIEFPISFNNIDMKEFILKFRVLFDKYLKKFMVVDFVRLKNEKKCYYILKKT